MQNYISSKLKIFNLQNKKNFALLNRDLKTKYKKRYRGKLILPKFRDYKKIKAKIKNNYLTSKTNDENMSFAYSLSKILKIDNRTFIKSMNSFSGLPHRYEVF